MSVRVCGRPISGQAQTRVSSPSTGSGVSQWAFPAASGPRSPTSSTRRRLTTAPRHPVWLPRGGGDQPRRSWGHDAVRSWPPSAVMPFRRCGAFPLGCSLAVVLGCGRPPVGPFPQPVGGMLLRALVDLRLRHGCRGPGQRRQGQPSGECVRSWHLDLAPGSAPLAGPTDRANSCS